MARPSRLRFGILQARKGLKPSLALIIKEPKESY